MGPASHFLLLLGILATVVVPAPLADGTAEQTDGARAVVVLSDLHMGVGRDASGAWHPYEDFRWADEFAAFLKAVDREGKGATDLDSQRRHLRARSVHEQGLRLCGSGSRDARRARRWRGSSACWPRTPPRSKRWPHLRRRAANRVVFVAGDHDAALLFPSLGRRLLQTLAVAAGRARSDIERLLAFR